MSASLVIYSSCTTHIHFFYALTLDNISSSPANKHPHKKYKQMLFCSRRFFFQLMYLKISISKRDNCNFFATTPGAYVQGNMVYTHLYASLGP